MTLGERLARLRAQAGLSQDDLAERLDVSRQSVSKWENNVSVPDLDKLVKLGALPPCIGSAGISWAGPFPPGARGAFCGACGAVLPPCRYWADRPRFSSFLSVY